MGTTIIHLEGLSKSYLNTFGAVNEVTLEIQEGEYVCFLGPSGSGKTTTLRMIAGYVEPTAGRVILDGKDITRLPPQRRNMGMVFQSYALFPHMTVAENIAFPLKVRKLPEATIQTRVREMLELVRLPDVARRRPSQLSGGQQQRVALARVLAFHPRILLLDEPLGALDVKLREHMQLELKEIQRKLGITTIHVTHDQEEALSLADRVVVMDKGWVMQFASPLELYERPASSFVADFVGKINLWPATLVAAEGETALVRVDGTDQVFTVPRDRVVSTRLTLGIRPEHLQIVPAEDAPLRGLVQKTKFVGSEQFCFVRVAEGLSLLARDRGLSCREGDPVGLRWQPERVHVFAP